MRLRLWLRLEAQQLELRLAARPLEARWLLLSAWLLLIALGNHRSEYCSFVTSSIGVGIWFAEERSKSPARIALLVLAISRMVRFTFVTILCFRARSRSSRHIVSFIRYGYCHSPSSGS